MTTLQTKPPCRCGACPLCPKAEPGVIETLRADPRTLRMLESIHAFAEQHGQDDEPEMECGDLQDLSSILWAMLTPEQRIAAYEKFRRDVAGADQLAASENL